MKLIIAEKPELAEDIANAILIQYKSLGKGYFKNDEYVVISSFGHVLELAEPEQIDEKFKDRYNIDLLPIFFNNWKKVPSKEPYKQKRLKEIKDQLTHAEFVIHAGDPDDEGQLLIDEILDYYNYSGRVYRVFVNDNIPKNIQAAFKNMKLNDQVERNNGLAAYARQMADKTEGINDSRLANIRLNTSGLTIGRVQTPTLALVVNRDLAIENHVKEQYYILSAFYNLVDDQGKELQNVQFVFKPDKDYTEDGKRIKNKQILESVEQSLGKKISVNAEEQIEKEDPPMPYSLNTLSSEMNEKYGYSSSKTLEITQSLRDKHKAITYNRSDSEYLKEEHFKNAPQLISQIFENLDKEYPVDMKIKRKCFNDQYAPVHHAIIPQEHKIVMNNLSAEEKNVYIAICNRFIMQFLPSVTRRKSNIEYKLANGVMSCSTSEVIDWGYKTHLGNPQAENAQNYIPQGQYIACLEKSLIHEEETKPLKKYTEGSLIKDMCSIAKFVTDPQIKKILKLKDKGKKGENGSIGTVATRGSIIDILKKRGFIEEQGKNIVSTTLGKDFINIIPDELKNPDLTAKWWILQEMVRDGKKSPNVIMNSVVDEFIKRKDKAFVGINLKRTEACITQCPKCGANIYKRRNKNKDIYYVCENHKNGCPIILNEKIKYFDNLLILTEKKLVTLLSGKEVTFKILNSKKEKYSALFYLDVVNVNGKFYTNLKKVIKKTN